MRVRVRARVRVRVRRAGVRIEARVQVCMKVRVQWLRVRVHWLRVQWLRVATAAMAEGTLVEGTKVWEVHKGRCKHDMAGWWRHCGAIIKSDHGLTGLERGASVRGWRAYLGEVLEEVAIRGSHTYHQPRVTNGQLQLARAQAIDRPWGMEGAEGVRLRTGMTGRLKVVGSKLRAVSKSGRGDIHGCVCGNVCVWRAMGVCSRCACYAMPCHWALLATMSDAPLMLLQR